MDRVINRMVISFYLVVTVSFAQAQQNPCEDFPDWPCEPLPAFDPADGVDCDEPENGPGDFFPGYPNDLTPLTEFTLDQTFGGLQGRLYVNGSTPTNLPPPVLDDHLTCMSEQIGAGDLADDPIVFMTMGTSSTNQHGSVAQLMAQRLGIQSDRVVWVNGAMAGWDMCGGNDDWATMSDFQRQRLEAAGIVAEPGDVFPQVQVLWLRWSISRGCQGVPPDFPDNAVFYRDEIERMVYDHLLVQYPNLKVIYFSSSPSRGYFGQSVFCYEMAWSLRMIIEEHVNNLDGNACDPDCTAVGVDDPLCEGPALAWGPYLWTNGNCLADPEETVDGLLNGVDYSDYHFSHEVYESNCLPDWPGLQTREEATCGWDCDAWQNPAGPPGCNPHLSPVGEERVGGLLVDFLQHNKHAALWYPIQSDETTGRRTIAADDAWTDEAVPTAPGANGDTRYLVTSPGGNNDAKHAFIKFDLPPDMAVSGLVRAGLMLMVGQKDIRRGVIYYTTDPDDNSWTESTLDWDWEAAHINLSKLPSFDMPESGGRGAMVNLDVTTIVLDAITAAADDITFIYVGGGQCAGLDDPGCILNAGEIHEHDTNEWAQTGPYAGPRLLMITSCEGDANRDGHVDPLDVGFVLARFGCPVGTGDSECDAADVNGDGAVDPLDTGYVLARLGECA